VPATSVGCLTYIVIRYRRQAGHLARCTGAERSKDDRNNRVGADARARAEREGQHPGRAGLQRAGGELRPAVRGNHERQVLTVPPERMSASDRLAHDTITDVHRAWLASLPLTLEVADGTWPSTASCFGQRSLCLRGRTALLLRRARRYRVTA